MSIKIRYRTRPVSGGLASRAACRRALGREQACRISARQRDEQGCARELVAAASRWRT